MCLCSANISVPPISVPPVCVSILVNARHDAATAQGSSRISALFVKLVTKLILSVVTSSRDQIRPAPSAIAAPAAVPSYSSRAAACPSCQAKTYPLPSPLPRHPCTDSDPPTRAPTSAHIHSPHAKGRQIRDRLDRPRQERLPTLHHAFRSWQTSGPVPAPSSPVAPDCSLCHSQHPQDRAKVHECVCACVRVSMHAPSSLGPLGTRPTGFFGHPWPGP
jgi:hypothetical protein